jgi:hypothetical protein
VPITLGTIAAVAFGAGSLAQRPTVFDEAFDLFNLESLSECSGFDEQRDTFLAQRGDLVSASDDEVELLRTHWKEFLASERGEQPSGCQWTISSYPAGFIATGDSTVIVLNPSNTVIGAPLPEGTTGDFVMDATRYSHTSLGAFRGAATIPPRSIAVIALR